MQNILHPFFIYINLFYFHFTMSKSRKIQNYYLRQDSEGKEEIIKELFPQISYLKGIEEMTQLFSRCLERYQISTSKMNQFFQHLT